MGDVRWNALLAAPDPGLAFQAGLEQGRQRQFENEQMRLQREQMQQARADREASVRAGKHVAAGDMAGARTQAAASGNIDLVNAIGRMSADQRAQAAEQAQTLAPVYQGLRQIPYEQRRAQLQRIAPQLAQRGIPADVIANYDPTDANLDSDMRLGMTLEQVMQQGAIDWQIIPQVGAFAVDAQGFPVDPRTGQRTSGPGAAVGQPPTMVQGQPQQPAAAPTAGADGQIGNSYADPDFQPVEAALEQQYGLPQGLLGAIRTRGERSNADQVSEAGARGVYQFTPQTRQLFIQRYGIDPWASPQDGARAAALHLRESFDRTGDWNTAILEYHGGSNPANWGPRTRAYGQRVGQPGQIQTAQAAPVQMPGQQMSIQDQAATGVIQAPRQAPPGYQWTQDGQLQAIAGGPGDQSYARGQDTRTNQRQDRQDMAGVVQNFRQDPLVRQFNQVRQSVLQLRNLGASGSPADDIAMVFGFMKALDSTSAVREQEQATVQNAAGVPDRVRNYYNQLLSGQRLTPQQRQDLVSTAERSYRANVEIYNEAAQSYRYQLESMGVDPTTIGRLVPLARGTQQQYQQEMRRRQRSGGGRRVSPTIRVRGQ